jgi:3-oxoacyl-[acyl-carrier-protein] synthase-1
VRLALTGTGLVTALGWTTQTCAALRAGLSRPRPAPGAEVDAGEGEMAPAVVIPSGFADGFFQTGAWVRLAELAVDALRRAHGVPSEDESGGRTALLALAPSIVADRFSWDLVDEPDALQLHFADRVAELCGLSGRASGGLVRGVEAGHCGLARAFEAADRALAQRQVDRVIVAAADSYLDAMSLAWLARQGRLKGPEEPVGLMPGEAGAALLVEPEVIARQRGAKPLAWVEGAAYAAAPPVAPGPDDSAGDDQAPSPPPPAAPLGRRIADVVRASLGAQPGPFAGDVVLDLNGEVWKANAWGHAQVLLGPTVDFDRCRLLLPAESLGETGAASAPVAAAYAIHLFRRTGAARALVVSIADDGGAAAVLLRAPAPVQPR